MAAAVRRIGVNVVGLRMCEAKKAAASLEAKEEEEEEETLPV